MEDHDFSAVSLLFASGGRPSADAIGTLARETGCFAISHNPQAETGGSDAAQNVWLELIAMGLTFDLTGLAPGRGRELPDVVHRYGLGTDFRPRDYDVITLTPGPHLSGGGLMFPVIRCLAWIGALLAKLPEVSAVAWHPARAYSAPEYFSSSVLRWIEGGAFPGLGLTSISPTSAGGLKSEGLSVFTGQELELAPELVGEQAEGAKIAMRLLHWMIENGRVRESQLLTGPSGEPLLLQPVGAGGIVKVLRNAH